MLLPILTLATRSDKTAVYNELVGAYKARAADLNERYLDGKITRNTWKNAMRDEVRTLHVQAYAAGKSGGWDSITQAEWGSVGARLRTQYQFLDRFADEIVVRDFSLAQMNQRTGLYGNASWASFEAAIAAEKGVPASGLPAFPADGTSECRSNCRCSWAIRKRRGSHFCTWRLGRADHCETCRKRSKSWINLELRNGVLVTPFEPIFYNP